MYSEDIGVAVNSSAVEELEYLRGVLYHTECARLALQQQNDYLASDFHGYFKRKLEDLEFQNSSLLCTNRLLLSENVLLAKQLSMSYLLFDSSESATVLISISRKRKAILELMENKSESVLTKSSAYYKFDRKYKTSKVAWCFSMYP
jgi:hypothetical protein